MQTPEGWARPATTVPSTYTLKPDTPGFPGLAVSEAFGSGPLHSRLCRQPRCSWTSSVAGWSLSSRASTAK